MDVCYFCQVFSHNLLFREANSVGETCQILGVSTTPVKPQIQTCSAELFWYTNFSDHMTLAAKSCWTLRVSNLVLADEAVGLQRFPPAQTDLLLIAPALDGFHRNGSGNWNQQDNPDPFEIQWTPLLLLPGQRESSFIPSSSVSTRSSGLSLWPSGLFRTSLRLMLVNGRRFRMVCTLLKVSYTTSTRASSFSGSLQKTQVKPDLWTTQSTAC